MAATTVAGFALMAGVGTAEAFVWQEVGDAPGTIANAQVTEGSGPLTGINGSLGGEDTADLFKVRIATCGDGTGCALTITAAFINITSDTQGSDPIYIKLFDAQGNLIGSQSQSEATYSNLAAGFYYIGGYTSQSSDPPFSFSLTGPTTATQNIVYGAVETPEPATIAVLGVGLVALAARRRRNTGR